MEAPARRAGRKSHQAMVTQSVLIERRLKDAFPVAVQQLATLMTCTRANLPNGCSRNSAGAEQLVRQFQPLWPYLIV
jgi:hypothetical protein